MFYTKLINIDYKRIINKIVNEFVYGSHLIALQGPAYILTTITLLGLDINWLAIIVAYLIPLIVYSYNYQSELSSDIHTNPEKVQYLERRKKHFPIIIFSLIIICLSLLIVLNDMYFNIFIIIILIGGILYTTVFKVLTKTIPGFKSIYTSLMWAYSGTFFVFLYYRMSFGTFFSLLFIYIFITSLINTIFFDIKDISSDKIDQLKTIPILLGKDLTIYILHFINVLSLIILFGGIYFKIFPIYMVSLSIFFPYVWYYIAKSKNANKKELFRYTYILADAEFVLWPIILIIGKLVYYMII